IADASAIETESGHRLSVTARLCSVELDGFGRNSAVGRDDDAVDTLLGLAQLLFAMPLQLCSPFIRLNGVVEPNLPAFEPPHDPLELRERVLEGHRRDIGGYRRFGHRRQLIPYAAISARTCVAALAPSAARS